MELVWDAQGEHLYETGCDRGVIFPWDSSLNEGKGGYANGAVWNGLSNVNENPEGAEANDVYADNIKYLTLLSAENLKCTIEAYTYPDEFAACNGETELTKGVRIGQQARKSFAFCYRSLVGNDTDGEAHGEKLHIIYGCKASPSEKSHQTVNDSPEASAMSWEISTTPIAVKDHKPTASIEIDSTKMTKEDYKKITDALWGTESTESKLLTPDEIVELLAQG